LPFFPLNAIGTASIIIIGKQEAFIVTLTYDIQI